MKSTVVFLVAVVAVYGKSQVPVYSYSYSTVVQHGVPYPLAGYTQENVPKPVYPAVNPETRNATKNVTKESNEEATTETVEIETTTEPESDIVKKENTNDRKADKEKLTQDAELTSEGDQGIYYIYHPVNGVLQKVVYSTRNDEKERALVAQLKYQNVEPIREPIYTYNPETFVLQPLKLA